jgi:glycosyltransferase involved in cell wall biosynthesis
MIRVAFFSSYVGLGGGETSLLSLMKGMDPSKYDPILVCPRGGPLSEHAREAGIAVALLPYRGATTWFLPALWAATPATRRIETWLSRSGPDVVHSDYHSLPYVIPACARLEKPVVFTCYGWWFRPRPWQRRFFREGPSAILAISKAVKQGFIGRPQRISPSMVEVLYLGVDPEIFRPRPHERASLRAEFGLPEDAPIVTLMGRYQDVKGHDLFVEAARRIFRKIQNAHFVIAGDRAFGGKGEERFERSIKAMVEADPELRWRVTFTGWVTKPEALLAASDVVVSASRFESFGMVVVEAMACGVPVVSTNVGGPSETVVDGETGFLVPSGRPGLIADRVVSLLSSDSLRDQMGEAGRLRAERLFSLGRYVTGFSELISSLIHEKAGMVDRAERNGTRP